MLTVLMEIGHPIGVIGEPLEWFKALLQSVACIRCRTGVVNIHRSNILQALSIACSWVAGGKNPVLL